MRGLLALLLGVLGLGGSPPARAEQISAEPSREQRCLRHEAGDQAAPEYPAALYNANRGGRVQVELTFEGPAWPPEVRVLLHEGERDLLEAVREHVKGLRVPCMSTRQPVVVLSREYVFKPDDRQVHWTRSVDAGRQPELDRVLACMAHPSGRRGPEFPNWAERFEVQGRVLVRMTFERPDEPPRIETFARPGMRGLAQHAGAFAAQWRAPCLDPQRPQTVRHKLVFKLGGDHYGFGDVNLLQLLKASRGLKQTTLALNTTRMGCPFELRMTYYRPLLTNSVGEPGAPVAERRPLLEWLEQMELDLPGKSLDAAWGDSFKVAVPCLNIDLKPKEKT
jgi:hypothetical protein